MRLELVEGAKRDEFALESMIYNRRMRPQKKKIKKKRAKVQ